jgi:hypothetical protein
MSVRTVTAPTADDVRAWGRNKGFEVGDRGRLSAELIGAFNKGRKHQYEATLVQPNLSRIVEVPGFKLGKNGRRVRVTYKVTNAELRAWAKDNGFEVGVRGRIPAEVYKAFGERELPAA